MMVQFYFYYLLSCGATITP